MFDTPAPNNLPVEPEIKTPPPIPTGKPTPPPAPRMRGGIMPPMQHEPEDILADVPSESAQASTPAMPMVEEKTKGGNSLKMIMIALIVIAVILVVAIGGLFIYRTYFVKPSEAQPTGNTNPLPSQSQMQNQVPPAVSASSSTQTENPPAVAPTPMPDIPKPQQVGASSTSAVDSDHDGLPDDQELKLGTDVNNPDTDGDGLSDGDEGNVYHTDPLVSDTDGDGISDGDEVHVWKTDPKNKDTDGDGYSDGQEVRSGYNPLGAGKLSGIK